MEALWHSPLRTDQRRILQGAQMLLVRREALRVGNCAAHDVQLVIYSGLLVLLLIYRGTSLFRICSRRLALVELVQAAVPLTLLALLAATAVASWRIRQRRE